jgi:CBS domain-containing protein
VSPRAACRLEQLGLPDVYDFAAGKAAWLAAGLPIEGSGAADRAREIARSDVPVCGTSDTLADVPEAARRWGVCVVRDSSGCVLGELPAGKLALGPERVVGDVMDRAPATIRPSMQLDELRTRFASSGASHFIVTTLAGQLVGLVTRDDAESG